MSTSETDDLRAGPCPCGSGHLIMSITTEDNPWSRPIVSYSLDCEGCSVEWEVSSSGSLTNRASAAPYNKAHYEEMKYSKHLQNLTDPLVDRYFMDFGAKTMTAELREMQRLGISSCGIAAFRKAKREGKTASSVSFALRNEGWLMELAAQAGLEDKVRSLLAAKRDAAERAKAAYKVIIRKPAPERW